MTARGVRRLVGSLFEIRCGHLTEAEAQALRAIVRHSEDTVKYRLYHARRRLGVRTTP